MHVMINIKRIVVLLILVLGISCSNAQTYSAKKASDLYPQIKETLDKIKEPKNVDEYIWIVSLFTAYNYELRGKNFFDSFNGKTPRNLISAHKSLIGAVNSRLNSNDSNTARSAKSIIENARILEERIVKRYIMEEQKDIAKQISVQVSKYYFWGIDPYIELEITNNSLWDLIRVYVLFSYENDQRKYPWGRTVVKLDFPSVLESGETRKLRYTLLYSDPICKIPSDAEGQLYYKITGIKNTENIAIFPDEELADPFVF